MHWMKRIDSDNGMVIFSVLSGYRMRVRLKELGFHFESKGKKWVCTVDKSQATRIEQIEDLLKATETRDQGPRFPYTVPG